MYFHIYILNLNDYWQYGLDNGQSCTFKFIVYVWLATSNQIISTEI